jgi:hypothetical protein
MQPSTVFWILVALAASATGANAQRMYRCGSTYQDHPCESGVADKVFRSGGVDAAGANALKTVADPDCIQRGSQAQQIMWARESGKTAEDQSRQATSETQRRLIAEVYGLRGSAPQVRDAIVNKCQQDKEQAAQSAALVAAALRGQAASAPAQDAKPVAVDTARDAGTAKPAQASGYNVCDDYKAQLDTMRSQERQGGGAQFMESLRQRRTNLESAARAQGCR